MSVYSPINSTSGECKITRSGVLHRSHREIHNLFLELDRTGQ